MGCTHMESVFASERVLTKSRLLCVVCRGTVLSACFLTVSIVNLHEVSFASLGLGLSFHSAMRHADEFNHQTLHRQEIKYCMFGCCKHVLLSAADACAFMLLASVTLDTCHDLIQGFFGHL